MPKFENVNTMRKKQIISKATNFTQFSVFHKTYIQSKKKKTFQNICTSLMVIEERVIFGTMQLCHEWFLEFFQ